MSRLSVSADQKMVSLVSNYVTDGLPWIPVNFQTSGEIKLLTSSSQISIGAVNGTAGRDLMFYGTWQTLRINAGAGDDTILYHDGNLSFYTAAPGVPLTNPARIFAGDGNDHVSGSEYGDIIDGGTGFDVIMYCWSLRAVQVNLGSGTAAGGSAGFDVLSGFEGIYGSRHGDRLTGSGEANDLRGRAGNDTLAGQGGNDSIHGEIGNDLILGEAGDDLLWGSTGADSLYGGAGADRLLGRGDGDLLDGGLGLDLLSYTVATGAVTASLASGQARVAGVAGTDRLVSIEMLNGSAFSDLMGGSDRADVLDGLAGNDRLDAGLGNDTLRGSDGADLLSGALGNDALDGGAGADTLWGGGGSDRFIFSRTTTAARDVIQDFQNNLDTLVLGKFGVGSFAALQSHASVINGDDLLLSFGNQSLVVANFSLAQLADDIVFV